MDYLTRARDEAVEYVLRRRSEGKRLVFTNGCFDILHAGHVHYLAGAARLGDALVVGVNTDESVRRLGKGEARPYQAEDARLAVISSLRCVSHAVLFGEDTPLELIKALQPDILVKGGDYSAECVDASSDTYIVGSAEVRAWGGQVRTVDLMHGYSTTVLIQKIVEAEISANDGGSTRT